MDGWASEICQLPACPPPLPLEGWEMLGMQQSSSREPLHAALSRTCSPLNGGTQRLLEWSKGCRFAQLRVAPRLLHWKGTGNAFRGAASCPCRLLPPFSKGERRRQPIAPRPAIQGVIVVMQWHLGKRVANWGLPLAGRPPGQQLP